MVKGIDEYKALLDRAKCKLPKQEDAHERFKVPEMDVIYEGRSTIWKNFGDIVDKIRRDANQVLAYILKEVGTAGTQDGRRVIFKGRLAAKQIEQKVADFIQSYVICTECSSPDTRLYKEGRTMILKCDACGGHRPVHLVKQSKTVTKTGIEEGKIYEFVIEDVGKKGDGIAKQGRHVIFIPGSSKGTIVKALIEKISGNVAFAKLVQE